MNVTFNDSECTLDYAFYENGRTALLLLDATDGQPVATASVNIPEVPLEDDEIAIKDYSENEGMYNVLNAAGVISQPVSFIENGFVVIPVCKLLLVQPTVKS